MLKILLSRRCRARWLILFEAQSAVKELPAGVADFGQTEIVNKLNNLIQRRFNDWPAAADHGEAKNGALPQVLIAAFGHRNIEPMRDPRLNSFDDAPFAFERMVLGNQQIELENSHDHEKRRA